MELKVKKLNNKAVLPKKAHTQDAGFDLTCTSVEFDGTSVIYGTGLAIELPKDYVGLLFPRSSVYKKDLILSNSVGVLDEIFKGEVKFIYKRTYSKSENIYKVGERIGQLVVIKLPKMEIKEVGELSESDRGENGFGSTGA